MSSMPDPVTKQHTHHHDIACDMAHGLAPAPMSGRRLIAVFASPVSLQLAHLAPHVGFTVTIVEPDPSRATEVSGSVPDTASAEPDEQTDIVVTDHDRPELGVLLAQALAGQSRWIGVMGSPRHTAPHIEALQEKGFGDAEITRVHRPIGLDIGSHSPAEIAISTIAGLLADRNGRSGGTY